MVLTESWAQQKKFGELGDYPMKKENKNYSLLSKDAWRDRDVASPQKLRV